VIHERGDKRTVASHFNKAPKGRLLRALAESDADPQSIDELVDAIRALGFQVEPVAAVAGRQRLTASRLDVVVEAL
jgi:ParB-like chromosome segregation protein Spo0J